MSEMPLWAAITLGFLGLLCLVVWPAVIITISIMSTSDSYEAYHEKRDRSAA